RAPSHVVALHKESHTDNKAKSEPPAPDTPQRPPSAIDTRSAGSTNAGRVDPVGPSASIRRARVFALPSNVGLALFGFWLAGCAVLLIRFVSSYVKLVSLSRRCHALENNAVLETVASLAHAAGIRRTVRLLQAPSAVPIRVPVTWDAGRPVILVPGEIG